MILAGAIRVAYTDKLYNELDFKKWSSNDALNGTKYSRMDQVKFFKGYLPQPFLNTLSQMFHTPI